MRIAMWSGPRNLSTAMMYAFARRTDCAVWDEPYYAAYLAETGLDHPARDKILAAWPQSPGDISKRLLGPIPNSKRIFYQKHMTQHMIPAFDRRWIKDVTNVFLIRHPARVIASYHAKRAEPTLADIGFREQVDLFDLAAEYTGRAPVVIDSSDVRANPEKALRALCRALGLDFDNHMLHWPQGGITEDGPWAAHWYSAIWSSTGFAGPEGPLPDITDPLSGVLEKALPFYDQLAAFKLRL